MKESYQTALKLAGVVLVGSLLGFSPIPRSVVQDAHQVEQAFTADHFREGAGYLIEIAQANPWWTGLWEKAGDAALQAGDDFLAVSAYEQAQQLSALSETGQVRLGQAYLQLGEGDSAEAAWLSLPESAAALQSLAAYYEDQGEIDRAVEVWHDLMVFSEQGGTPHQVYYFGLLIASDTPPKALAYLDQSRAGYPGAGQVASAIRDALDQEPAYQLVSSGQALAAINYWHLADHAFAKALLLRPDYPEAWIYRGEALQHLPDPAADPLETLQKGLSLAPDSPLANLFLGLYWQRQGSHETALDFFRIVEESWPENPDVLVEAGKSLAALGDLEGAYGKYQSAVSIQQDQSLYYRQLAEFSIAYAYNVSEIGLPAARMAVQLDSQEAANLDVLGQALLDLEDEMNAIKLFQDALALDPAYAPAYYHLGIVYSAQGDRDRAVYNLQQALANSDNPALSDQAERLLSTY